MGGFVFIRLTRIEQHSRKGDLALCLNRAIVLSLYNESE